MKKNWKRLAVWMIALAMGITMAGPAFADTGAGDRGIHCYVYGLDAGADPAVDPGEEPGEEPGEDPAAQTGWQTIDGKTYYIDEETMEPVKGVTKVDDKYYCFNKKGVLVKNGWMKMYGFKWHSNKNGVVQKGLKKIGKNRYYFYPYAEYEVMKDGAEICMYGVMCDWGLCKNYIIGYNGKCFRIPSKKTDKECKKIAKLIAKCSGKKAKGMKDLEKVQRAAYTVSSFYERCTYTMQGKYYNKPYGVFYAKQCSCAGTTRALGLVLKYMGFKWQHKNENKYTHQWCVLKMDGKKGWADGQIGMAGYGKHPAQ